MKYAEWPIKRRWAIHVPSQAGQLTTEELIEFPAVCLLGAAGLGKTHEMNLVEQLEKTAGHQVVSISLAAIASDSGDLRSELERLASQAPEDTVWVLDSLDEAMVPIPRVQVLLKTWIGRYLRPTSRLRVACRSAVWPSLLTQSIRDVYGEGMRSVELLPLGKEDVAVVAEAEGVDPAKFCEAIDAARAQPLASRPLTMKLLVEEYRQRETIEAGNRDQLFARAVLRLCQEPIERVEMATDQIKDTTEYVRLAEKVATIMLLSGNDTIAVPGSGAIFPRSIGLDVLEGLGFGREKLRILFTSGLFEGRSSSGIRFVHRQVAEYLAGTCISRLHIHQIRSMLGRRGGETSGIAGPLQETAAWAAYGNPEVAAWIAECDPEIVGRSEIADEGLRRQALLRILDKFRNGDITSAQLHTDEISYFGLRFEGMEKDLSRVLREHTNELIDMQIYAIKLTEKLNLMGLAPDLANLALDPQIPLPIRTDAAHAIVSIREKQSCDKIKPLCFGVAEDFQDDLKGYALFCNWPGNLSDEELFRALTSPKASSYLGNYKLFLLLMIDGNIAQPKATQLAMEWVCKSPAGHADDPISRLAAQVAFRSLDHMNEPGIAALMAEHVFHVSRQSDQPFYIKKSHGKERSLLDDNDTDTIRKKFDDNQELRRKIITTIATDECHEGDLFMAARAVPGLLSLKDFQWLIETAVEGAAPISSNFARLAAWLPWPEDDVCFELRYNYRDVPVVRDHFPPLEIRLDSPLAQSERNYS